MKNENSQIKNPS